VNRRLLPTQKGNRVTEIRIHGVDIEYDRDNELCFSLPVDRSWFYFTETEARQFRDFLNAALASPSTSASEP
jgi:hypothetical protein